MNTLRIEVPLVPPSANELRRKYRSHWVYAKLKASWQDALYYSTTAIQRRLLIQSAQEAKKIRLKISIYHTGVTDTDNLVASVKPCLDSLVELDFLVNDDPEHLELIVNQHKCKRWEGRTIIEFEPEKP